MISITGTIVSKTKTINDQPSAELELDPVMSILGRRSSTLDISRHVTIKGPEAEAAELGDRYKLTLEKLD
jgi:hypothetical protein